MSHRWRAAVGVLGLAGLGIAAYSSVDDVREQALPGVTTLAAVLVLQIAGLVFAGRAWVVLFPPGADRRALARGLYTSQLTKYLPAGGLVQAASQVALSSQGGVASAALRLPIFSLGVIVASATLGSALALDTGLPGWQRLLAALGLGTLVLLDRRVVQALLRLARRVSRRVPERTEVPPQGAILRCYGAHLANMAAVSTAFALILDDLAGVEVWVAAASFCLAWGLGYVVLPVPSGLGVREAVLIAALPGVVAGSLLAASVAQRLLTLVAEAVMTGVTHGRGLAARRLARPDAEMGHDAPVVDSAAT